MEHLHKKNISIFNVTFLIETVERRMKSVEIISFVEYFDYLEKNAKEAELLFDSMNINYSEFFRESLSFEILEQNISPGIVARTPEGGEIRVWSAGCATGQEAYSIAMQFLDIIGNSKKNIRIRVFASDICEAALFKAEKGTYGINDIQNVTIRRLNKYFVKTGETYTIIPELRRCVNFIKYDMLDLSSANPPESIYGDFDIVMCSNMLMYYESDSQRVIINKLKQAVSPTGYLVTGEVEKKIIENCTMLKNVSAYGPIFIK